MPRTPPLNRTARSAATSALLTLASALAAAACDGGGGPPTGPGEGATLRLVSGYELTDTIEAPIGPLVVEVRGGDGEPRAGAVVRFDAEIHNPSGGVPQPSVFVAHEGAHPLARHAFAVDTTDARGRASVRVHGGRHATPAAVRIGVQGMGLADTATYLLVPGKPDAFHVEPRDTTLYVGQRYTLRLDVRDRLFNRIAPGEVTVQHGPELTGADSVMTAAAYGRTGLVVTARGLSFTVAASVVPQGTLLAQDGTGGIVVLDLAGTAPRRVATGTDPRWLAGGERFVHGNGPLAGLFVSDLNGNTRALLPDTFRHGIISAPRPTRDGRWIYFTDVTHLYRIRPDGTGLEGFPLWPLDGSENSAPSPSPTGERVAFVREHLADGVRPRVLVYDVATRTILPPVLGRGAPEWSRAGDRIAITGLDGLVFVNPDGSGRVVSPAPEGGPHLDWSPDGRWLVASGRGDYLVLVEVATGRSIQVPHFPRLFAPSWRP